MSFLGFTADLNSLSTYAHAYSDYFTSWKEEQHKPNCEKQE